MKKFLKNLFACFIILSVFAAVLFFLGWTQFKVPSDGFGVIVSKTGGISKQIVEPGVFSWHWEFLIPSNAQMKIFKIKHYKLKKNISYTVPNGDFYGSLLSSDTDFSANYDFTADAFISRENILELFSSSKISNEEEIEEYINNDFQELCGKIVTAMQIKVEKGDLILPELLTSEDLLKLAGYKKDSMIEYSSIKLSDVTIPDFRLFKIVRDKYIEKQKLTPDFLKEAEEESAAVN